jgi:hypothetical protein
MVVAAEWRPRYIVAPMMRSTLKLVVRRETLRVLAGMEMARVGGGGPQYGTGGPETGCPLAKIADTASPETGCPLVKR